MNETLEIERCREIEADLRAVTSKARFYGSLSTALLVTAGVMVWATDRSEPTALVWSMFCFGMLFGIQWIIFVAEAIRAKLELSLHLAKCQVLGRTLNHGDG
jgi:hypothetical protein